MENRIALLEQQIAGLTQRLDTISTVLTRFMNEPYAQQKAFLTRIAPYFKQDEDGTCPIDRLLAGGQTSEGPAVPDDMLIRIAPLLSMYEKKEGVFKSRAKSVRVPRNRADWMRVQGYLDDGGESYSKMSKALNIPESTCRDYAKMSPEEVAKLPPGLNPEVTEE